MNIFWLDHSLKTMAEFHTDSHIVKMPLETAQILSTVCWQYAGTPVFSPFHVLVGDPAPYKPTHQKHPCVVWAGQSAWNWKRLQTVGIALCKEYTHRYGREHKCEAIIKNMVVPDRLCALHATETPPPKCMPVEYQTDCLVESYRNYYRLAKSHLHKWTRRDQPSWIGAFDLIGV